VRRATEVQFHGLGHRPPDMLRILILVAIASGCGAGAAAPRAPEAPVSHIPVPVADSEPDPVDFEVDLAVLRMTMEDRELRLRGAETLLALGPRARPAMVNLYDCLRGDQDLVIARVCAQALAGVGPVARTYLEGNLVLQGERAELAAAALRSMNEMQASR